MRQILLKKSTIALRFDYPTDGDYPMLSSTSHQIHPPDLRRAEAGQGLVEYALILVLVAVVVIVILAVLGPQIGSVFLRIQGAVICTQYLDDLEADRTAHVVPEDAWLAIANTPNCMAVTTSDPPTIHKTYGPP